LQLGKKIQGYTPMLFAAYEGQNDILNMLLDMGVNINERSDKNQTALIVAVDRYDDSLFLVSSLSYLLDFA
jgi:ankyrin repeat protein